MCVLNWGRFVLGLVCILKMFEVFLGVVIGFFVVGVGNDFSGRLKLVSCGVLVDGVDGFRFGDSVV